MIQPQDTRRAAEHLSVCATGSSPDELQLKVLILFEKDPNADDLCCSAQ